MDQVAAAVREELAERNRELIFPNGFSVEAQPEEAFRWCREAAEQGFVDAQTQLGFFYARGIGVERDYAEARRWYALAAERGHSLKPNSVSASSIERGRR